MALTKAQKDALRASEDAYLVELVAAGKDTDGKEVTVPRGKYQQVLLSETGGAYEIHTWDGPDGQGAVLIEHRIASGQKETRAELLRGTETYREHAWAKVSGGL